MKQDEPKVESTDKLEVPVPSDVNHDPKHKPKPTALIIVGVVAGLVILATILAIVFWPREKASTSNSTSETNNSSSQNNTTESTLSTPKLIIGNPNAKVSIVEYADFKCPLCNRFYRETEPQIKKDYIDKGLVNIEYRPLPIIAKDSTVAALGAYCSAEQNAFEKYHNATFDYIYTNFYSKSLKDESSNIFTLETLKKIAGSQGLDVAAFETCMTSSKYSSAIEQSEAMAKKDGANATPTIIIGSQKISGAQPFAIYKPLIEAQLR